MPALGGTCLMGQFRRVERGDLPQMHVYLQLIFLPDENYIEYLQITLRQKRWSRAWGIPTQLCEWPGQPRGRESVWRVRSSTAPARSSVQGSRTGFLHLIIEAPGQRQLTTKRAKCAFMQGKAMGSRSFGGLAYEVWWVGSLAKQVRHQLQTARRTVPPPPSCSPPANRNNPPPPPEWRIQNARIPCTAPPPLFPPAPGLDPLPPCA